MPMTEPPETGALVHTAPRAPRITSTSSSSADHAPSASPDPPRATRRPRMPTITLDPSSPRQGHHGLPRPTGCPSPPQTITPAVAAASNHDDEPQPITRAASTVVPASHEAIAAEQSPTSVVTTTAAAAAAAADWLRELGSLRDDQERIYLLAEVLTMADAGEPSHALVQHVRLRIQSARTCGLSPDKTAAKKRRSPKSTTRPSKPKRRSSSMTCTTTTEKTSGEHAALPTSSPEKETVRREKDTEKEVKRRSRSKTKKSTEESLTDSPSSGSSGEIATIPSAGEALASNLSREALASTTGGTKRTRSGSARLLSKIKIKHTSSTFGTSHEGHRTKYDLDEKMEMLEHDEDGLSDQEQSKKGYAPGVTCTFTHARTHARTTHTHTPHVHLSAAYAPGWSRDTRPSCSNLVPPFYLI